MKKLVFWFFLIPSFAFSQDIENLLQSFDGNRLTLSYDLIYPDTARRIKVELFSSIDSYTKSLSRVTGDAGERVKPGKGLKIVWEPRQELPPDFDKEVVFRIRASLVPLPVVVVEKKPEPKEVKTEPAPASTKFSILTSFKSSYRRGKALHLKWTGGKPNDKVAAELIGPNGGKESLQIFSTEKGETLIVIPPKQKTGSGYKIKLTPGGRQSDATSSLSFAIVHRTPLLVRALPILVAGVIIYELSQKPSGNELPAPINPAKP